MFLSNKTICEYIQEGKINITGELSVESMGISMNLGDSLLIPLPNQTIDTQNPIQPQYSTHNLLEGTYTLKPNEFVLGVTKQSVSTSKDILTIIDGRSTLARLGMSIHITAMVADGVPFNPENSVLEIKNNGNFNIVLHAGDRVGTYLFAQLTAPIEGEKISNYSNQTSVTPPII